MAIAQAGSFRQAAESLHISQPPLSIQIKDLERELSFDLFVRENRAIRLTDGGRTFLLGAQKILGDVEKAKTDARLASDGKLGTLSIRFISSAVAGTLQTLISSFKKTHPLVELDLEQSNVSTILQDVERGRIDIGFVRFPILLPDTMISAEVLRESYCVALPASHRLAVRERIGPVDLKDEKLILYPRSTASGSVDDILSIFADESIVPEIVQEAVEQLTIIGLVATGMGYSIVPECMAAIPVPGVRYVAFTGGHNRTGIELVALKTASSATKAFFDAAIKLTCS